ncbi:hypothetical protein G2W53_029063 [Senna tora]|uniref:Uncharacterized protein n=1 Tax=Senna tora TaxID=362788 RepID=A0A834T3H3_9FABA|nr:hypothetical protein G2W53_029063 [Senna tora]
MTTRIFLGMKLRRNWVHVGTHKREVSATFCVSDMNATARIWLILVASNIKPSKYLTKISRKTALLLYLLMINQPVKLEAIIYKSLCKVAYNGRAGCALIFPHMISDFYFNAGVPEDDTDAKFKPKHQLDYKRVGKGRVDPDDPCTSEAQAHPTAEASAQPLYYFLEFLAQHLFLSNFSATGLIVGGLEVSNFGATVS